MFLTPIHNLVLGIFLLALTLQFQILFVFSLTISIGAIIVGLARCINKWIYD